MQKLTLPPSPKMLRGLKAGQIVLIDGIIYTARDAAHKKLFAALKSCECLPFKLENSAVYYCGPCPAPPSFAVGSCGPTTSSRVDFFTPSLLDSGLKVMIGKGPRSLEVVKSIVKNGAVYLAAVGGCGALYAKCVTKSRVIAYPELLSEAVFELKIENFPAVVAIDSTGGNIYT